MTLSQISSPGSLTIVPLDPDHLYSRRCPACTADMELHQPDADLPDRLLWTCHACTTWFLMDVAPDRSEAVLVRLPDYWHFRAAMDGR